MTQKVYKTAQGKTVDMGSLVLKNEKTRAIGNMGINARGDQIDDMNRVIQTRNEQVNAQYNQQIKK